MNIHEDWLMRQIETMVTAVLHVLFHTDRKSENIEMETSLSDAVDSGQRETILAFLQEGKICEAENWLFENLNEDDISRLHTAVYFYSKLNKLSDEYLAAHNFSREEIESGLSEVCGRYGYEWLFS